MAKTGGVADESYSAKIRATKIFRTVICVFLCCLSVLPFLMMIINATNDTVTIQKGLTFIPGKYLGKNYKALAKVSKSLPVSVWKAMLHSCMITVPATVLQVYFATFTAYGLTTYNFKLKNMAWSFIMAIMMIPAQVSIIGLIQFMLKINLYNTYWPLIIPAMAAPSTVYFMKQYMQGALSLEIIEAARIDGSGEFRTFNTVVLPLMKPAMATQAIFAFIASWNNLYTPQMLLSDTTKATLPMFIAMLSAEQFRQDYGVIYLSLCITIVPIMVVYFALSKYIIAGVALGGVKE
jgi:multiple sugar transport system permease protein